MTKYYEIKIKGHLNPGWAEWFEGFKVAHLSNDVTLLFGCLPDQAALYGILKRVRDFNLTLISVNSEIPTTHGKGTEFIEI